MIRAMYTAASGMMLQSRKQDQVSSNLLYAQIPGYKAVSLLTSAKPATQPAQPSDVQTTLFGQYVDGASGALRPSLKPLDLAIDGSGLFAVETPSGTAYTRDGRFSRATDGTIRDGKGNKLLGEKGPLQLPEGTPLDAPVTVDRDGTVSVGGEAVDRIKVRDFPAFKGLQAAGARLYYPTGLAQPQESKALVLQQMLEDANVSTVEEMVRMVETTRAFESYQKMLQTIDEATGQAVSRLGRVG